MKVVILAAGAGTRMGEPKALLSWGRTTLLEAHIDRLRTAGMAEIYVVVRESLRDRVSPLKGAHCIVSTQDERLGPAGSIVAAMQTVMLKGPVLVVPCDMVPVRVSTLRVLRESEGEAVVPRFDGRGGHPVKIETRWLRTIGEHGTLRGILQAMGEKRVYVAVDDPAVRSNLNTREDVLRWGAVL